MDMDNYGQLAGIVVASTGILTLFVGMCHCYRKFKRENDSFLEPAAEDCQDDEEKAGVSLSPTIADESDANDQLPSHRPSSKKVFLSPQERRDRALLWFPDLLEKRDFQRGDPRRSVEKIVTERLDQRIVQLQQNEANFGRLQQLENAEELCIALGVDTSMVRMRYEAIRNLKRAFGLKSKTPTILSVRHLIHRLGVNNSFGNPEEDLHKGIAESYREKDWLSYLGVQVSRDRPENVLKDVKQELTRNKLDECYMHGTTGTALQGLYKANGRLEKSQVNGGEGGQRHDFGPGFYCFKNNLEGALSFAIDRCWPQLDDTGSFLEINPSVVLFPKPRQLNRREKNQWPFKVGEKHPFGSDPKLKKKLVRDDYEKFTKARQGWRSQTNLHWKEFVKLARHFNFVPVGIHEFYGLLHDCDSTSNTDNCAEPKVDSDNWEQHCFTDPGEFLGFDRLFIELFVNWNEWIDSASKQQLKEADADDQSNALCSAQKAAKKNLAESIKVPH